MQHWVAHLGPPILFLLVLLQQAGVPYPITPVLIVAGAVSVPPCVTVVVASIPR